MTYLRTKARVLACLVAAIVAFALSQTCYALEETANVMVDGEYVEFTDQQPVIIDGRTLVPIRAVMEKMGKTVTWDEATQTTTISDDEISIFLTIGDNIMRQVVVDSGTGEVFEFDVELDVAPQIIGGRTLLPIRAVVEGFGTAVTWDEATSTVMIITSQLLC